MAETEEKLLKAAIDTFMRYGFRRTTMGDVAKAAGLSRQTLYASYSNKEELLASAIETLGSQSLDDLKNHWQSAVKAQDVLEIYCEHVIIKQFEMLRNMPDSDDLISGLDGASKSALQHVQEQHAVALSSKLQAITGIDPKQADTQANFFVHASKGLKHVTEDLNALRNLLRMLVSATTTQLEMNSVKKVVSHRT